MTARIGLAAALLVGIVATVTACGGREPAAPAGQAPAASTAPPAAKPAEEPLPPSQLDS